MSTTARNIQIIIHFYFYMHNFKLKTEVIIGYN